MINILFLCFLSIVNNDISGESISSIDSKSATEVVKDNYTKFLSGLFVEYDLYVVNKNQERSHKLSVVQFLNKSSHFMRIVHWYHVDEYDFYGQAELDPVLNWYLWTPQKKTQVWVTKGIGHIRHSQVNKIQEPDIQYYSDYLGILPPDRICDPDSSITIYNSSDYYFPYALDKEHWQMVDKDPPHCLTFVRQTDEYRDTFVVSPKYNYSLIKRKIELFDSENSTLDIEYSDFVVVDHNYFLPMKITIISQEAYYLEMIVKNIQTKDVPDLENLCIIYDGTIINDSILNKSYFSGKNSIDLLELTIQRMQLASLMLNKKIIFFSWEVLFRSLLFFVFIAIVVIFLVIKYGQKKHRHIWGCCLNSEKTRTKM